MKILVSETPVLKYFDPTKATKISVDASSKGMEAVLLQDNQPVAYASKALKNKVNKIMLKLKRKCWR